MLGYLVGAGFSIVAYCYFFWVLPLAASGFLINLSEQHEFLKQFIPYNIDHANENENPIWNNLFYLSVWAIAHSTCARDSFKNVLTKVIPENMERPIYVMQSSYLLHNVLKNWAKMDIVVWEVPDCCKSLSVGCFVFGWAFLVSSTFALDHFDLFGLRQGLKMGDMLKIPGSDSFVTLFHYKLVRHPIMTGFFIMFWSTPIMTQGHLLFSTVASLYIVFAIKCLEEPTLVSKIGPKYEEYMETTPAFCPFLPMKKTKSS